MITISITATGSAAGLQRLRRSLASRQELHARIARDVLELTQTYVAGIPDHKTANRLGATPTMHLEKTANQIAATSDDGKATILVPRASRLAAAFGPYTVVPKKPNGWLTIPVAAESYGRRARTFTDLVCFAVGGGKGLNKTLVLARKVKGAKGNQPLVTLYLLVRKAAIKEDRSLLPFDDMRDQALETSSGYIKELANPTGGLS